MPKLIAVAVAVAGLFGCAAFPPEVEELMNRHPSEDKGIDFMPTLEFQEMLDQVDRPQASATILVGE